MPENSNAWEMPPANGSEMSDRSGKRAVIFGGGRLGRWALKTVRPGDLLVGADAGAAFLLEHGLSPDAAIGDFDSVSAPLRDRIRRESRSFLDCDPVDKDRTDMEMAIDWALARDVREIEIVGATGTRLDHTLANLHLLRKPLRRGVSCAIRDATNVIRLTDRNLEIAADGFAYVSLLPLTEEVRGITLRGFKYPLENATLRLGETLGVSNELVGASGTIQVAAGELLVIQSRDAWDGEEA